MRNFLKLQAWTPKSFWMKTKVEGSKKWKASDLAWQALKNCFQISRDVLSEFFSYPMIFNDFHGILVSWLVNVQKALIKRLHFMMKICRFLHIFQLNDKQWSNKKLSLNFFLHSLDERKHTHTPAPSLTRTLYSFAYKTQSFLFCNLPCCCFMSDELQGWRGSKTNNGSEKVFC